MLKNDYIVFLLFFTMLIANGMQLEDFYGDKKAIPILHTYTNIADTTMHSEKKMPFIKNFGAIKTTDKQNSFSIELLQYDNSLLHKEAKYKKAWGIFFQDQSITTPILVNPHKIVITQNQNGNDLEKTVFIPIQFLSDENTLTIENKLLLLALVAGEKHFQTTNATITIEDNDMQTWKKLFEGYQSLIELKSEPDRTYLFNLNFKIIDESKNAIQNILILVHSIWKNFDIESTTNTILKDEKNKKIDNLNYFLKTEDFVQKEQEKTAPKFSIMFYYTIIKRKMSQNFLQPIKNWFDYFYHSYRFWFR